MMTTITMTSDGYPDPRADKKTKNSTPYGLQYAKAMYGQFGQNGLRIFFNDKDKYRRLANYAMGIQQVDRYKKFMDVFNEDEPGKETFVNIDWSILNLAYKFINIMSDKITDTGYDVQCHPIDPMALEAKKDIEYKMRAVMEHKQWFEQLGINLDPEKLGFDPSMLPDHSDELEMHMAMTYKDRFAMEAEMAVKLHMTNNDFEQIRKEYVRDCIIYGPMAVETRNDKFGNTRIKRIPPEAIITANSVSEDFKDVVHAGYLENITFSELQIAAGDQLSSSQYEDILKNLYFPKSPEQIYPFVSGLDWNRNYPGYREKKVTVMKFYFKTGITNTYIKKKDSRDNNKLYPQGPNTTAKEGQELIKDTYEVVYEGTWIVGSDYIYDYKILNDMEVDLSNPTATRIPIHIICPNMLNGQTISILHTCIPILDQIQLNWNKFQHLMAKMRPDGHAIDVDALLDAPIGKGGKNYTPRQVMNLFFKTGDLIYSGKKLDGRGGNGLPVTEMKNGNYEKAFGALNNVFTLINLLRQISGMNEGVDASTPSSDALVGTLQIAAQGADHQLGHLYKADKLLVKHISESLIKLTQNAVMRGDVSGYVDSIGLGSVKFWMVNKDISLKQYGLQIVTQPSPAEWSEFYGQIAGAWKDGSITMSDYLVMKEMTNLKQARQYMAMMERRRQKESIAIQQQNIQQQADLNQQNMLATEQAKQQTLQLEVSLKSALLDKEKEKELSVLDRKYGYDIQLKQMELAQKDDAAQLQARSKIIDSTIKTQAQIQKNEEKVKAEV